MWRAIIVVYLMYLFACCCAVNPTVTITHYTMDPAVGESLSVNCNISIFRGIIGSVEITWAINGTAQNSSSNYMVDMTSDSIIYSDVLDIPELQITHNNTVYSCEAKINASIPLRGNDSWTLTIRGE